jgi:hypothetical protein
MVAEVTRMSPRTLVSSWRGRRRRAAVGTDPKEAARLALAYPGSGPGTKRNLCVELACVPGRSWR